MTDISKAEQVMDLLREELMRDKVARVAAYTGVSKGALYRIRSGKTKWPRDPTLFCMLHTFGFQLSITRKDQK